MSDPDPQQKAAETALDDILIDAADVVAFEAVYHLSELLPCSIRSCRTKHKHGYLVSLRDGGEARIGHDCGRKLLGHDRFVRLEREFVVRRRREQLQRTFGSPEFDAEAALAELTDWRKRVAAIRKLREAFSASDPNTYAAMVNAVTKNYGRLMWHYESGPRQTAHTLRGSRWLVEPPEKELTIAANSIRDAAAILRKEVLSDHELQRIPREIDGALHRLRKVADTIDDFENFIDRRNLAGVARWLGVQIAVVPAGQIGPGGGRRITGGPTEDGWDNLPVKMLPIPEPSGPISRRAIELLRS